MAKVSTRSPLFREKAQISEDVAYVLNDVKLHHCAKFAVVDQAIWIWSEFDGKYRGCKLWSKKAKSGDEKYGSLVHEHAVPRKEVRHRLFHLVKPTPASVAKILDIFGFGVVVTKLEDATLVKAGLSSKMPADWDGHDVFARYKAVGIELAA